MDQIEAEREKYLAAKARVAVLKGFYIHVAIYAAVMVGLVAINAASGDHWWAQWPLIGWGIGVLAHGYFAHFPSKVSVKGWEERKIKETMSKM